MMFAEREQERAASGRSKCDEWYETRRRIGRGPAQDLLEAAGPARYETQPLTLPLRVRGAACGTSVRLKHNCAANERQLR